MSNFIMLLELKIFLKKMYSFLNIESKQLENYSIKFFSQERDRFFSSLLSFIQDHHYESVFILTDKKVGRLYIQDFLNFFNKQDIKVNNFIFKGSEKNKNLKSCQKIYSYLADLKLGRNFLFINLGGGVVSDLGGFVASTYKRGVDFINIPTSLLAMVDASIGGKLAVDLLANKNLVGAFVNPKLVLINIDFLKTLSKREFLNGWMEVIKHGIISDEKYLKLVLSKKPVEFSDEELFKIVKESCLIKYSFVKEDEYDFGKRQLLNFGHTIGHALESFYLDEKTSLKHGEAVAWGILIESYISNINGFLSKEDFIFIKRSLANFGLRTIDLESLSVQKLNNFLLNDKKNKNKKIIFNLIKNISEIETRAIIKESDLKRGILFIKEFIKEEEL